MKTKRKTPHPVGSSAWFGGDTAPKDGKQFIAYDPMCGLLFTMHWSDGAFSTDYERWSGRFTHWMPLPKPPNAELSDSRPKQPTT